LVFIGDFCDRGPNSPAVLTLAQELVQSGRAVAVLSNHEINLLREDAKDGSSWFFDARVKHNNEKYAPYRQPDAAAWECIVAFLCKLPIGLDCADLRVIHTAWQEEQIEVAKTLPMGSLRQHYDWCELGDEPEAAQTELEQFMAAELEQWEYGLENMQGSRRFCMLIQSLSRTSR
jgi:hypothetical protein